MKNLSYSLLKYFSLLFALIFTASNLFYQIPDKNNLLILQIILGIAYVSFSIVEFVRQLEKSNLPNDRFFYLPLNFLANKFIKIGAFTIACVILFMSKSSLVFLAGLLLTVILADILVFALRLSKKVYYISLYANYIFFSLEDEKKIFASQIDSIEYRYEIFYLKLKGGKIKAIEVSRVEKRNQRAFTEKFVLWVVCNNLHFTDEAKEKLADIIAEAI